jgi:transcriptional regulator with XRE-family HTH domain
VGVSVEVERESLARFLARRLREIRTAKGLSQRELEKLGINPKYYQRIEAGSVNLTLRSLEKVAFALGIGVLEIFQVSGEKGKKKRRS